MKPALAQAENPKPLTLHANVESRKHGWEDEIESTEATEL